ncbi:PadR family transcriptional regulator [Tenacibaculum sp.]|uniref:PadR family transcriptional regulator n=1 Tax=Tenacibaculum sp. TaxID=1906242 RepID=UPI003AA83808
MGNHNLTLQEIKILSVLEIDDMYGYQILKELGKKILLGSLYNTLKSMERKGYVESKWGEDTGQGGRRKYYKITGQGEKVFEQAKSQLASILKLA